RKSVRELAEAVGSGDPQALAVKHRYVLEALGQTEKDLFQVRRERSQAQVPAEAKPGQKEAAVPGLPEALIEQELSRDPELVRLTARKTAVSGDLDRMVKQATR